MEDLTPLERIQLAMQDIEDSKRTVWCNPEWESRIKTMADVRNVGGFFNVVASNACPEDTVYVVDENAMEAQFRQSLQRSLNESRFFTPDPRPLHERLAEHSRSLAYVRWDVAKAEEAPPKAPAKRAWWKFWTWFRRQP